VIDKNAKPSTSSKKRKAKTPTSVPKRVKKRVRAKDGVVSEEEDYDQLDPTPENGAEDPVFPPSKKQRRITDPDHRHLEENQELPFPSGSDCHMAPLYLKHTTPVRQKVEVLITPPSKPPRSLI